MPWRSNPASPATSDPIVVIGPRKVVERGLKPSDFHPDFDAIIDA
jgi:hypothetical protein